MPGLGRVGLGLTATRGGSGASPISDTFTRADSALTLGSTESPVIAWEPLNGTVWGISSNQAKCVNTAASDARVRVLAGSADGKVSVKLSSAVSGQQGVIARVQDNTNLFRFIGSGATLYLQRFVAGVATTLGTSAHTNAINDVLALECRGTSITAYLNGTAVVGPIVDANFTAVTYWGMELNDTTQLVDNFSWVP